MIDVAYGGNFACKTNDEAWDLFKRLSEDSQWRASSSHFDVPWHVRLCMNCHMLSYLLWFMLCHKRLINCCLWTVCLSMFLLCMICVLCMPVPFIHQSIAHHLLTILNNMFENVNVVQGFSLDNNHLLTPFMGWRNHPNVSLRSQWVENSQVQHLNLG